MANGEKHGQLPQGSVLAFWACWVLTAGTLQPLGPPSTMLSLNCVHEAAGSARAMTAAEAAADEATDDILACPYVGPPRTWAEASTPEEQLIIQQQVEQSTLHSDPSVCVLTLEHTGAPADVGDGAALMCAVQRGHLEVCRMLLQRGVRADARGGLAVALAAASGHVEVCRLLLEWPVHPARADALDNLPLLLAVGHGRRDACELLLRWPVHAADPRARLSLPVQVALCTGNLEILRMLC